MSLHFLRWELPPGINISALLPSGQRRGIYVLEFSDGSKYVGKSENVVVRFRTHTHGSLHHEGWSDITAISFANVPDGELFTLERAEIARQRNLGAVLRNKTFNLGSASSTDLDLEFSVAEQKHWIQGGWTDAHFDFSQLVLPETRPETKFEKSATAQVCNLILDDIAYALYELIPKAPELEKDFWSLTDFPSTAGGRYSTLNTGVLEFIVWPRGTNAELMLGGKPTPAGFINLLAPSEELEKRSQADPNLGIQLNGVDSPHIVLAYQYDIHSTLAIHFPIGTLRALMEQHPWIKAEARKFAVELMRYRRNNLFRRWHSTSLTQLAYERIGELASIEKSDQHRHGKQHHDWRQDAAEDDEG